MQKKRIPKPCIELYLELKDKPDVGTVHERGQMIKDLAPGLWDETMPHNVYEACRRWVINREFHEATEVALRTLPEPADLPPIVERLEVEYADCLMLSDVHLPYHDEPILAEALTFCRSAKLRRTILNGDILDLHWASNYVNLTSEDVGESFRQLGLFYVSLLDSGVTEILHNFGNHEDRIMRKTGGKLGLWSLIAMSIDTLESRDRIRVRNAVRATNRHYIRLTNTPDGIDWVIGHPRRYRKKRLSLMSENAQNKLAHVAGGHQHHLGVTLSENGHFWAVDLACTQDPERTEYTAVSFDPHTTPVRGFAWLFDGVPGIWWDGAPDQWKSWMLEVAKLRARYAAKMKRAA